MELAIEYDIVSGYFLEIIIKEKCYTEDDEIINIIGLGIEEYKTIMVGQFDGYIENLSGQVYFKSRKNAEKANKWLENMLIASKLRGII